MDESSIKIFIVEALNKIQYPVTKIIYADNEDEARRSASISQNPDTESVPPLNRFGTYPEGYDSVFMDKGMSLCLEVTPKILATSHLRIKIKYNDVIYDLEKNVAEDVLSDSFV